MASRNPLRDDRIQTTLRIPHALMREFRDYLEETGQNANTVLQGLLGDLLERHYGSGMDEEQLNYLLLFWKYLPAAAAIKEVYGRVIFANPEFRKIVGWQEVTGALPSDYFRSDLEVARRVMAHDRAALDHQRPILSVDVIPVGDERRDRLAIRFPIFDRGHLHVDMTGVIGFDLEQVELRAQSLEPGGSAGFDFEPGRPPGQVLSAPESIPASMLRAFIYNLPGILTVKELDSRLVCVNAEYTRVTGRQRSEVLGKRPSENWPGVLGETIEARDQEVKTLRKAVMSVESIPTRDYGNQERLNIRFPIFNDEAPVPSVVAIGTIGFDYRVFKSGIELLRDNKGASRGYAFLPAGDPDSLRGLPIR